MLFKIGFCYVGKITFLSAQPRAFNIFLRARLVRLKILSVLAEVA
jgi:hypothetical protein